MKHKALTISALVLALVVSAPTLASEIYKWTDDEGNVHYGDRPSGESSEQRIGITYKRTDRADLQARVDSHRESQSARQEARQARAEEQKTAEEQRAEAEERETKCEDYRARLETFVTSPRLYREDENGEREYLDEKETQDARQRAEELVAEYCSS